MLIDINVEPYATRPANRSIQGECGYSARNVSKYTNHRLTIKYFLK